MSPNLLKSGLPALCTINVILNCGIKNQGGVEIAPAR
jgi:hypothetical protein